MTSGALPGSRLHRALTAAVWALAFLSPALVRGEGSEPISRAFSESQAHAHAQQGPGPLKAFFSLLLGFYQTGISPADGPTCRFAPTCSGYARDALRGHGLGMGILMTGDRLMRCNGYGKSAYPLIGPERNFFDPVP